VDIWAHTLVDPNAYCHYDGVAWSCPEYASVFGGPVRGAAVGDGQLVATDEYTRVLRVDHLGNVLADLGLPPVMGSFGLIADSDGVVYAYTHNAGSRLPDGLARFDGASWEALPLPTTAPLYEIAVLAGGRVLAKLGTALALYEDGAWSEPASEFVGSVEVARLVGEEIWLPGGRAGAGGLEVEITVITSAGLQSRQLSWSGGGYEGPTSVHGVVTFRGGHGILVSRTLGAGGGDTNVDFLVHPISQSQLGGPHVIAVLPAFCPGGLCGGRTLPWAQLGDGTFLYGFEGIRITEPL
jgi:hypothetical protein